MSAVAFLSLVAPLFAAVAVAVAPHLPELRAEAADLAAHGPRWDEWRIRFGGPTNRARSLLLAVQTLGLLCSLYAAWARYPLYLWPIYATHWNAALAFAALALGVHANTVAVHANTVASRSPGKPVGAVDSPPPLAARAALACVGVALPWSLLVALFYWVVAAAKGRSPLLRPAFWPPSHAADTFHVLYNHGGSALVMAAEALLVAPPPFRYSLSQGSMLVAVVSAYSASTVAFYASQVYNPVVGLRGVVYPTLRYDLPGAGPANAALLALIPTTAAAAALLAWAAARRAAVRAGGA